MYNEKKERERGWCTLDAVQNQQAVKHLSKQKHWTDAEVEYVLTFNGFVLYYELIKAKGRLLTFAKK